MITRITIVKLRRPTVHSINDELQWFGNSLGLFGERDRDRSCFRIFLELMKAMKHSNGLSSDDLADHLGLTRATVIHHLNSLMARGIAEHRLNQYVLRSDRLTSLIEDIHRDMDRTLNDMKKAAEELDRVLNL